MAKDKQRNGRSRGGGKPPRKQSSSQGQPRSKQEKLASKVVCKYTKSKQTGESLTVKFKDDDGEECKETLYIYKRSDKKDLLIDLAKRLVKIADRYDYWDDGQAKKIYQTMGRCLEEDLEDKWIEKQNSVRDWSATATTLKAKFIKHVQELAADVCGKYAYEQQIEAMEDGYTWSSSMTCVEGAERLWAIQKELKYLSDEAEDFTDKQINRKFLLKALPPKMKLKYVEHGGESLTSKTEILELLQKCERFAEVEKECNEQLRQREQRNSDRERRQDRERERDTPNTAAAEAEAAVSRTSAARKGTTTSGPIAPTTSSARTTRATTPVVQDAARPRTATSRASINVPSGRLRLTSRSPTQQQQRRATRLTSSTTTTMPPPRRRAR